MMGKLKVNPTWFEEGKIIDHAVMDDGHGPGPRLLGQ